MKKLFTIAFCLLFAFSSADAGKGPKRPKGGKKGGKIEKVEKVKRERERMERQTPRGKTEREGMRDELRDGGKPKTPGITDNKIFEGREKSLSGQKILSEGKGTSKAKGEKKQTGTTSLNRTGRARIKVEGAKNEIGMQGAKDLVGDLGKDTKASQTNPTVARVGEVVERKTVQPKRVMPEVSSQSFLLHENIEFTGEYVLARKKVEVKAVRANGREVISTVTKNGNKENIEVENRTAQPGQWIVTNLDKNGNPLESYIQDADYFAKNYNPTAKEGVYESAGELTTFAKVKTVDGRPMEWTMEQWGGGKETMPGNEAWVNFTSGVKKTKTGHFDLYMVEPTRFDATYRIVGEWKGADKAIGKIKTAMQKEEAAELSSARMLNFLDGMGEDGYIVTFGFLDAEGNGLYREDGTIATVGNKAQAEALNTRMKIALEKNPQASVVLFWTKKPGNVEKVTEHSFDLEGKTAGRRFSPTTRIGGTKLQLDYVEPTYTRVETVSQPKASPTVENKVTTAQPSVKPQAAPRAKSVKEQSVEISTRDLANEVNGVNNIKAFGFADENVANVLHKEYVTFDQQLPPAEAMKELNTQIQAALEKTPDASLLIVLTNEGGKVVEHMYDLKDGDNLFRAIDAPGTRLLLDYVEPVN